MSDFTSEFWNLYVIVLVAASILACAVLLIIQGKATFTPGKTMGHVWDETLEEYNNPMPKWWNWLFVITVVFSAVYLVLYPGLGKFPGILGWTSAGQHKAEVDKVDKAMKPIYDKYQKMDVASLAADKPAMEMGKRLYLTYCMQCHGADARGSKGFPNLTDGDWLYGGEGEKIEESIAAGRMGVMPPHAHLGGEAIKDLANYVRSLSSQPGVDAARAAKGKEAFMTAGCAGCHTPEGTGMQAVGAPNLTDKVWLYGSSEATVTETITNGRQNKMPPWKEFLGDGKVHLLAAYVYSLGGGVKSVPKPAEPAPAVVAPASDKPMAKVYFDTGKADLGAEGQAALQAIIDFAKANGDAKLSISGFHDATGNQATNEELAKNRAFAIRDALKAAGVAEDRIQLQKPAVTTGDGDAREARRVEVTVL